MIAGCINPEPEISIENEEPNMPTEDVLEFYIIVTSNLTNINGSLDVEFRLINIGNESIQVEKGMRSAYSFVLISDNGTKWNPQLIVFDPAMNPEKVELKPTEYINFSVDIMNAKYRTDFSEESLYLMSGTYEITFFYSKYGFTLTSNTEEIEIVE